MDNTSCEKEHHCKTQKTMASFSTDALVIIEAAPDALVIVNEHGSIVHFNAQAETLFGYERQEVIGQPIETLIPERFRSRHASHLKGYFGHPRIRPMGAGSELWGRKKSAQEFPLEISLSPLQTENGVLTLAAIRDITERKKAEAKFRGILEATPDALVIINHQGKIVLVNAQVENLFGYHRTEILDQHIEILMPERFRHKHELNRTNYFHNPHTRPMGAGLELFGRKKSGEEFPVEISLSPLDSEEGMWALAAVRDATQRKNFERTLQENNVALQKAMEQLQLQTTEKLQAEKKLAEQNVRVQMAEEYRARQEEFINTICHEIRNPMTGIYGNIDFLQQTGNSLRVLIGSLQSQEEQKLLNTALINLQEITREIEQCVKHQKAIIDDVLDLSKLEIGKMNLAILPFRLKSVMEETSAIFSAPLANKKLQLLLEVPSQDIWVKGDAHRLKMVLVNLLANALKFTDHGHIEFRMQIQEYTPLHTSFSITVEDTGIGMTPEEQSQLFQPFARVAAPEYEGSGLGLLISKRFVERMGGQISVKSQKGLGTSFTITLACETTAPTEAKPQEAMTNPGSPVLAPKRVLVVEDNIVNQRILCRQLSQVGHSCEIASNGQEALEKYTTTPFDLIFMDIEMPVMGGLEATKLIRKREELLEIPTRIPIVGLSAYAHVESVKQAHLAGMDDYITKPYEKDRILSAVKQWTLNQAPSRPDTNKRRLPFANRSRVE